MKKLLLIATCGLLGTADLVNAQETPALFATNTEPVNRVHSSSTATAINERAVKNFNRSFPGKTDESWYAIKDGYIAQFNSPHLTRCYFDTKGNWKFSVANYGESSLPASIRNDLKSAFPEYAIFGVQEIKSSGKLIYLMHLEGMFHWKTVRLSGDDMDVIETFDK